MKKVLVVDIGGTSVKLMISRTEKRKFASGSEMKPKQILAGIKEQCADWNYEAVSIGFPSTVANGQITKDPKNLSPGWIGLDFKKSLGKPTRVVNDAAMQALGSYHGGRMLFLGLGTGLGSTLVWDKNVLPLELGDLPYGGVTIIIVKLNSLVDHEVIEKLYEASCAGVRIDLIIRGICCLRPMVPGLSENIRVVSIVGRFLEHSRIYYFENDGDPVVYLASADWMPRNFMRRVEIAFPIEDPTLRDELINDVLPRFINDRVKARELQADGTYVRLQGKGDEPRMQAQLYFRERSRKQARKLAESQRPATIKLSPITTPRKERS